MATKTITVDLEAYQRLKSVQRSNESFSQTIKRAIRPPMDVDAFSKRMGAPSLSREATEAIEQQVASRHQPSERAR